MPPLLQATGISVGTPAGRTLVDGVDLSLHEGQHTALIGASGSGKSLLAAALAGAVPPTLQVTGSVHVDGHPRDPGRSGLRDLVLVRQDSADALNPLVRVGAQLDIPLRALGEGSGGDRRRISHGLLAEVGLEDPEQILDSFPGQLSGGQRQRVCIALGLACRPRLLITDECTTALDLISQARVLGALAQIPTLVFITHDLSVAAQLCEHAIVFDQGRIVEDITIRELFDAPAHPVSRALTARARGTLEQVA